MKIIPTVIKDCYILEQNLFLDDRGRFSELYRSSELSFEPKQISYSYSKLGTLRGLHKTPYAKLVSCLNGSIFDVCVDLREDSKTYMKHIHVDLTAFNMKQILIPSGCAHGFYAYHDSIVLYLQDDEYQKERDEAFCYKLYDIPWPNYPILISEKDLKACNDEKCI